MYQQKDQIKLILITGSDNHTFSEQI